jgi:hypothetical protein
VVSVADLRRGYLGLEEGILWVRRSNFGIGILLLMVDYDILVFSTEFIEIE